MESLIRVRGKKSAREELGRKQRVVRSSRKKIEDISGRKIVLRGEWDLLYGARNRIYEYAPKDGVEGINAVWTFEWTSTESVDDMITQVEQDIEANTAWLEYLRNLRDTE